MPANLENSAVATGLERSVFFPIPKKGNAKECSNYCTIALTSHASKEMLKILPARLQQYVNCVMFKLVLEKQRNQRSNCLHPLDHGKSKRVPEKLYFCFIDYVKAFDSVDHNKLDNSERGGNTRPPDLPLEKFVCRSGNNC